MARMKIFNTLEEDAFESPPVFNSVSGVTRHIPERLRLC